MNKKRPLIAMNIVAHATNRKKEKRAEKSNARAEIEHERERERGRRALWLGWLVSL